MRILTIGTGVIGTIYSWVLSDIGHDVTHFVRPGKAANLPEQIEIDILDKRKGHKSHTIANYNYKLTEKLSPTDDYDLILVPVKQHQLEPLLKQISALTGKADCLIFTGNWRGTDFIDACIPHSSYILGDPIAGGTFKEGRLVCALNRKIHIGEIDGTQTNRLKQICEAFHQADIEVISDSILHWHWVQYAINAGLWPALVRSGSFNEVLKNKELMNEAAACAKECLEVCALRGVDVKNIPEASIYLKTSSVHLFLFRSIFKLTYQYGQYMKRCSAHALADSEEIKTSYYDVLNYGKELGLPMIHLSSFETDIVKFSKIHDKAEVQNV